MCFNCYGNSADTNNWTRKVKTLESSLETVKKLGKQLIKSDIKNYGKEACIVGLLTKTDEVLLSLKQELILHITPDTEAYNILQEQIQLKNKLPQYETKISQLQKKNEQLKKKQNEQNLKEKQIFNENSRLRESNGQLKAELQIFYNQSNVSDDSKQIGEKLERDSNYYIQKFDENVKEYSALQSSYEAQKTVIQSQKNQINDLEREVLELKRKSQLQTKQHNADLSVYLDQKVSESRSQIHKLEQQLALQKQYSDEDQLKLNELLVSQKTKFEQSSKENRLLQQRLAISEQTVTVTKTLLDTKLDENKQLKLKIKEFESYQPQTVNLTTSLNESSSEDPYVVESLDKIQKIRKDTEKLKVGVEQFSGTAKDKDYLELKELLIRNSVKLDDVETEGHFIIREKRKYVIDEVQHLLDVLKNKTS